MFHLILSIGKLDMKTLKKIRKEKHLTVTGLAFTANLSNGTIYNVEKGLPMRLRTQLKIAKALKMSLKDIDFNLNYKLP